MRFRVFGDFAVAFWTVTAISFLTVIFNTRFDPRTGDQIFGRAG